MNPQLQKQIIKLRTMAQLVIEECDSVMKTIEAPVSPRVVSEEKRLAIKRIAFRKRLVKQS